MTSRALLETKTRQERTGERQREGRVNLRERARGRRRECERELR